MVKRSKSIRYATTFGDPRPVRSQRFYEIANSVLPKVTAFVQTVNVVLAVSFFGLLVYLGVFISHEDVFVSDGTLFSCQVDALIPTQKADSTKDVKDVKR